MKRVHIFEFEDFNWFPHFLRLRMTRLIGVIHRLMKSDELIAGKVKHLAEETNRNQIVDLCSGSSGPMPDVVRRINEASEKQISLTLTDLYPQPSEYKEDYITYLKSSVNAADVPKNLKGLRTMICSFHHMPPDVASKILENTVSAGEPIFIYELSDNKAPLLISWIAFPINIVTCLFITPFARPMSWQQLVFTYIIPVIPICFAWDGAVSNMRTYTEKDIRELLSKFESNTFDWEIGKFEKKGQPMYVIGRPK